VVVLDGLDEVADNALRGKVVDWIGRESTAFPTNRFLVSSRPAGYRPNPLQDFALLAIRPFTIEQTEHFVRNWYLANDLMAYQKDDQGVRDGAARGAESLLSTIRGNPILQQLAVNPLLLTMMATIHWYRSALPGRRAELLSEICDVFLGQRQAARGIPEAKARCPLCGSAVTTGSVYRAKCVPDVNRENLLRQAKLGQIATHSAIGEARRSATQAKQAQALRKWNSSELPKWLDEDFYRAKVLPWLANFTVKKIRLAIDVSHPYATLIKRGDKLPIQGTGLR
jgi:DNA-binding transcriptional regulator YdaS (Cro superfamily)